MPLNQTIEHYPLSSPQREIWFDQMLYPEVPLYNIGGYTQFHQAILPPLFESAVNLLVQQHDALRTVFVLNTSDDMPMQTFLEEILVSVPFHDFSRENDPSQSASSFRQQQFVQPFELVGKPLFRFALLKISETQFEFVSVYHHLMVDGWAISLINKRLGEIYSALLENQKPNLLATLKEHRVPSYLDFINNDRLYVESSRYEADRQYWLDKYQTLPEPLFAPRYLSHIDQVAPSERQLLWLERPFYDRIQAFANNNQFKLYQVLLGALYVYFTRTGGREELAIGLPVLNRNSDAFKETVGLFVGVCATRFQFGTQLSFRELLKAIKKERQLDYPHQRMPIDDLNRALGLQKIGLKQLFDIEFNYVKQDHDTQLGGLFNVLLTGEQTPLTIYVLEFHDTEDVQVFFAYNLAYFKSAEIEQIQSRFVVILEYVLNHIDESIGTIPLLTQAEQQQLLAWNQTEKDYPLDKTLVDLFQAQVEKTPENIAVVFEDQQLNYRELNRSVNQLAHYLRTKGVGVESLVGICVERSLEMVISLLGVLKAGGAYVPLDPNYPAQRLQFMLEDSNVAVLLSQSHLLSRLPVLKKVICLDSDKEQIVACSAENPAKQSEPINLAYVIYTSGTTGMPKGAMVEHRGMLNHIYAKIDDLQLSATDVIAHTASLTFDISVWQAFTLLCLGGRIQVFSELAAKEPQTFLNTVLSEGITILEIVPSLLRAVLPEINDSASHSNLSRLRWMILTGEALPPDLCIEWFAHYPEIPLFNAYGPTECSDDVAHHPIYQPPTPQIMQMPIGKPISNMRLYVLDKHLQLLPAGIAGELYVAGIGVGRGYWNAPTKTAQAFIINPFNPNEYLYKTGDLARWLFDGNLEYLGRIDDQVKLRGYRIELAEIEVTLTQHEAVKEAVLALYNPENNPQLVAYVTLAISNQQSALIDELPKALRTWLKARLPEYMVPASVMVLDKLPLTPNGKIDRKALPEPDLSIQVAEQAPHTETEHLLCNIWSQVLNIEVTSRLSHFFEAGGHSLSATQLVSRIRKNFAIEMPLRLIFDRAVLMEQAEWLDNEQRGSELPPIKPLVEGEPLVLSFAQQRLWFMAQLEGQTATYNMPVAFQFFGQLNGRALQKAFIDLIQHHESLRLCFPTLDGKATVQRRDTYNPLRVADISQLSETEQKQQAQQWIDSHAQMPFDLSTGPLFRLLLLKQSQQEYILLFNIHHIISDGWSIAVLIRSFCQLYNAYVQNQAIQLPELPIQYTDFAAWQRNWLQGAVLDKQLVYWLDKLAGVPELLELPTDYPRPAVMRYQGEHLQTTFTPELTQKIKQFSREQGVTIFMTLFAAYNILLSRYSGQTDLAVGTPIGNRTHQQTENLIGFFVNTLVFRTQIVEGQTFQELLQQVKQTALEAYSHQDIPFEYLVEKLNPTRSLSHSPLVQVTFVLETPEVALELDGVNMSVLEPDNMGAKFDITLSIGESKDAFVCTWEYCTDLFHPETIIHMGEHFQVLLEGIVSDSAQSVSQLPLLTQAETQQLLTWNQTETDYPVDKTIVDLFQAQVEKTPDNIAIVFNNQQLSYLELNRKSNQLAHYLLNIKTDTDNCSLITDNCLVGICIERSFEMVIGVLGILKAGAAYVPLDPDYPAPRLQLMLENAQVTVLLSQSLLQDRLPMSNTFVVCLDSEWQQIARCSGENPVKRSSPESLAYMVYTSGSTGQPKGILTRHKSVVNYLSYVGNVYALTPLDRILQLASLSFDASVRDMIGPLTKGAQVLLVSHTEVKQPATLLSLMKTRQITGLLSVVPSLLKALVEANVDEEVYDSLRVILVSGEALPLALCQQAKKVFGQQALVVNQYGPTECTMTTTYYPVADLSSPQKITLIGRPIPNTQVYILDANQNQTPIGVPGELHIGGIGLARGYFNRPEQTSEKFIQNPLSGEPNSRLYKTGDLARYLPDGNLEYLGRLDYQVKLRGFRIELSEIESTLLRHEAVKAAVVVLYQQDNPRLIAYVTLNQPIDDVSNVLRLWLKAQLPEYMLPASFMVLDQLPLTPNGKINRKALPAPDFSTQALEQVPSTETERLLCNIWSQVLGIEITNIRSHFFEVGGHSLLATQLVSRIQESFGIEMPLRLVFEQALLMEQAQWLDKQQRGSELPAITRASGEPLILSFAQQRMWFLAQLEGQSEAYNIFAALHLSGPLNETALQRTVITLIQRHDSLRLYFPVVDGEAKVQQSDVYNPLHITDLTELSQTEQQQSLVTKWLANHAQTPFDLNTGPLFYLHLIKLNSQEQILLFNMHHIISDAWSMSVFIREWSQLYSVYVQNQEFHLPELPIQYTDYAAWQRNWLQGEVLAQQLAYWTNKLTGAPELLELPTDYPRPDVIRYQGKRLIRTLTPALTQQIKQFSQQQGVTLFMTLLAAFNLLLSRYSGQTDLVVGSPIANRTHRQTEHLIGFFVNTLVLRTQIVGTQTFSELLKQVRQTALEAYSHQDIPFEYLVEQLNPTRSLNYSPLFQVGFVLQNVPVETLELSGLTVSFLEPEHTTAKYDLTLIIEESAEALECQWEYNTELFCSETISRMTEHFQVLLEGILTHSKQSLSQLPLLTEAEQQQWLAWNQTKVDYPFDKTVVDLFQAQVEKTPDKIVLMFDNHQLSYGELNQKANQLAHYLLNLTTDNRLLITDNCFVGICVERSLEMVIGVLGVLKAGGAYVPLDPDYPKERLQFMLEDSQVPVLLSKTPLLERLPTHQAQVVYLDQWETMAAYPAENPPRKSGPKDLAYVIYTSGSTGRPKGVMIEHVGLTNVILAQNDGLYITPASRLLQFASFSFDASISEMMTTLTSGATLIGTTHKLSPDVQLIQLLNSQSITHVTFPPSFLTILPYDNLPSLQVILVAGETCSAELVSKWSPGRKFFNCCGATEVSIGSTLIECQADGKLPSVGKPMANTRIYILDANLNLTPLGIAGELCYAGIGVGRGYLNRPELTRDKFVEVELFGQTERIYRSGDLARWLPDGNLEYIGRIDNQVKMRGFRIELDEIEQRLHQHPSISEAAVIHHRQNDRLDAYLVAENRVELWPSIAEFYVYDEIVYRSMATHESRNQRYIAAFQRLLIGKTVVEVGPGPEVILSRLALQAGAKKIYAIELLEDTYRKAENTLKQLDLTNQIILIHGDATQIQLPEPVDYCISEIVGSIGGAEGAAVIINSARRFLKDGGNMIPQRSLTKIAAISLPESLFDYGFSDIAAHYIHKIFAEVGYAFDLRLCVKNLPLTQLISNSDVFEDLDYTQAITLENSHDIHLQFNQNSLLTGLLVWLTLQTDSDQIFDTLYDQKSWIPVYLPLFTDGITVTTGDKLVATITRRLCDNGFNPDYLLDGTLYRQGQPALPIQYHCYHFNPHYRNHPFYQKLFAQDNVPILPRLDAKIVKAYLSQSLPDYMIPGSFTILERMPLTPNGKIDRKALPAPDLSNQTALQLPQTETELMLCGLWSQVLGIEITSTLSHFFDMGGHSLLATQLVSRIRESFGIEMPLRIIFEQAHLQAQAQWLEKQQGGSELPPITPLTEGEPLVLSFAQQRLWFLAQMEGQSATYNIPEALRLTGLLNETALQRALTILIQWHDSLRFCFPAIDGEARVQLNAVYNPLSITDLSELAEAKQQHQIIEWTTQHAQTPFDLSTGPLLNLRLLKLSQQEHILLFNMHHIISDGWSITVLIREWSQLYNALVQNQQLQIQKRPIQYTDYAAWQRNWLQGKVLEQQLSYWRNKLAGVPELLELPTDYSRPAVMRNQGTSLQTCLEPELLPKIKQLSQQHGVTPFMTLLAIFNILLYRYSGQTDLVVGSPIANRTHHQTENLIGFFVNTLVLRTRIDGTQTFQELVKQIQQTALEAYSHQDIPFEYLVEQVNPSRSLSHSPLFQVMFTLQNTPAETLELSGLNISFVALEQTTAKFDLVLAVMEDGDLYRCDWRYSTDLFRPEMIARMAEHFQILVAGVVNQSVLTISQLPLLTETETQQLLAWNQTETNYPKDQTIVDLFQTQVEQTPENVAVVFGEQQSSYWELNQKANQIAHYLLNLRNDTDNCLLITDNCLVGICVERSIEMVIGLLGILKAGGAYVPLDPDYPPERLQFMLEDSQVPVLLTQSLMQDSLPSSAVKVVYLDSENEQIALASGENPVRRCNPDNLAYVIYTSGSTGIPKGVSIPHVAVVRLVKNTDYIQITQDDRIAQASNTSFDAATFEIWGSLLNGAKLVGVSKEVALSPARLAQHLQTYQINTLFLTTALFNQIAETQPSCFSTLKTLLFGGELVDPHWVSIVLENGSPQSLLHVYGPTETTTFASWHQVQAEKQQAYEHTIPIGKPLANTKLFILDANYHPTPPGIPGELCIAGSGLARDYLNRPELTAEKFVEVELFGKIERIYKTGDLAKYWPDGHIEYLGRLDHQVKLRGFRIELGEIEARLQQHEAIKETIVVLYKEDDNPRLVAYVTLIAQIDNTADILRTWLKAHLPDYMVPASFTVLETMPLTPNGKIDRQALPAPDLAIQAIGPAPRTETEHLLCNLWSQVLGIEITSILSHFFEIGGHSLLATQLVSRIRESFGIEMPLPVIFEQALLKEQAEWLDNEQRGSELPPIIPLAEGEPLVLSFAQQRLWFLAQLEGQNATYNMPVALNMSGSLNETALQCAFIALIQRHDSLRLCFPAVKGEALVRLNAVYNPLSVTDLRELSKSEQQNQVTEWISKHAETPFDLNTGPLLRLHLLKVDQQEHILLFNMHHIISDGWSMGLLIREWSQLYSARSQNQTLHLPALKIQYTDYAAWQRNWLQGAVLEKQITYWTDKLTGLPELLELPTDYPRPAIISYQGKHLQSTLAPELLPKVKQLSQQQGVTVFMTLLATFNVLLYRYSGQNDLAVGIPIANRTHHQTEDLIGFFVNTLVLRSQFEGTQTFLELLAKVKQTALDAYSHQDIPFEYLVEQLNPSRSLSYSPLFQVMFILQNMPEEALELSGLNIAFLEPEYPIAKFDLTLSVREEGDTLVCQWEYNTDLFRSETIARMSEHFQVLLAGILNNPAQALASVPLLTEAEQQQLLVWNQTERDYPVDKTIVDLFQVQVEKTPENIAVVFDEQQISYWELNRKANQLAHYLLNLNNEADNCSLITDNCLVGICVERSVAMVIGLLGILKAGGAYVPFDPSYPEERLQFMLEDSKVPVLLSQSHLLEKLPHVSTTFIVNLDSEQEPIAKSSGENPVRQSGPADLAYVLFTSGSTGKPKGVMIEHKSTCTLIQWALDTFRPEHLVGVLASTSINFDLSVYELFVPLCMGGQIFLVENVLSLPTLAHHDALTLVNTVPSAIAELSRRQAIPDSVKVINLAGEPLSNQLAQTLYQIETLERVYNLYGPSEDTTYSTFTQIPKGSEREVNIGRPIANTQVYILDANHSPTPLGIPGELCIGGHGLAKGYLNRPELTQEKFIDLEVFGKPRRLYKTGDLARWLPDGNLEYLGRIDHQVKLRGFRIELGEIETALHQHEAVKEAVVVLLTEEDDSRLAAYVTLDTPIDDIAQELRTWLKARLPEYMVPAHVIGLEKLPLTPNGKLDRKALPAPDAVQIQPDSNFIKPQTSIERQIAEIWIEVLELEQVGIHDNFFDIGGHSLLLMQVQSQLEEILTEPLPVGELFQYPTIHSLADYITRNGLAESVKPISQTSIEQQIVEIWQEVLELEEVGIHDNFFDLGGHSLLLRQVQSRLEEILTEPLSVADLFQYPTIHGLATYLADNESAENEPAESVKSTQVATDAPENSRDIAIIGMAARFPGAENIEEFWNNLRDGLESIQFFSDEESLANGVAPTLLNNPNYVKAGGVLEDIDLFDASFFGYTPKEANILDPQQRLFLEMAWTGIENAGYDVASIQFPVGVFAGAGIGSYFNNNVLPNQALLETLGGFQLMLGNRDLLAASTAYKLNLKGPTLFIQTACSTSLVAVHLACQSLLNGECEMALAGGASILAWQKQGYLYQEGMVNSPDGHCRAFDAESKGAVGGSGVGVVVLKPLNRALADGDTIHAVIKGSAINNDGMDKVGFTAPSVNGQAAVITKAMGELDYESISYLETHGTGTTLGDPIEISALTQAYRAHTPKTNYCALGSVKTNVGHLDTAAGIASLMKTVLALKHREIPPSLHFKHPNPQIDFANSPFFVNAELRTWQSPIPRRAGVSSFGIGGTNAHVVLEEAPVPQTALASNHWQLVCLSARSENALKQYRHNLAEYLTNHPELNLADTAYTLQLGRKAFTHRGFVIGQDLSEIAEILRQQNSKDWRQGQTNDSQPPVVFMFPGQGSQYVNMALGLYQKEPLFQRIVDECAQLLEPHLGLDLRELLYPADDAKPDLKPSSVAQPALFVTEYALAKLCLAWGIEPAAMIGHSIGEYVAACLAGVFSLPEALQLVAIRGQLMQALPEGEMLSILLPKNEVENLLKLDSLLTADLFLGAHNAPNISVVSGTTTAINTLIQALKGKQRIMYSRLQTSNASHSPVMEPMLPAFREQLQKISLNPPQLPYISNLTGTWITSAQATSIDYWCDHLLHTVLFSEGIQTLLEQDNYILLELGPDMALTSFALQQQPQYPVSAFNLLRTAVSEQEDYAWLLNTLGQLWLKNVKLDWPAIYANEQRLRIPLPTYPFERQRYWIDPTPSIPATPVKTEKRPVDEWFYLPHWEPAPLTLPPNTKPLHFSHWLIFNNQPELSVELAQALQKQGAQMIEVQTGQTFGQLNALCYTVNPQQREDYQQLFDALRENGQLPEAVLHLWCLDTLTELAESQSKGFYSLLFLAQTWPKIQQNRHLFVVSNQIHAVTGAEALQPMSATLLGPVQTIGSEYPDISCRNLDIVWPTSESESRQLIIRLLKECQTQTTECVIAYRNRQRWTRAFKPVGLPEQNYPTTHLESAMLRDKGVYLITGGLGGIGFSLATYLATSVQAKLVLIGRSALPDEQTWEAWLGSHAEDNATTIKIRRIRELQSSGAEVLVCDADVSNREQMQAVIEQAKARFGTIHGVIHTAGVPAGGVIELKTVTEAARIMTPKVQGSLILNDILEAQQLDFIVLCSSVNAVISAPGQVDYCGANAFLDTYAQALYTQGVNAISINWDGWQEVGMAANVMLPEAMKAAYLQNLQINGIKPAEGIEAFARILAHPLPQVLLSTTDLQQHFQSTERAEVDTSVTEMSPVTPRPALTTKYVAPRSLIEQQVADIWQLLLGFEPIGIYDDFFELGGHSLLAIQLSTQIEKQLGTQLPVAMLLQNPNIEQLAMALRQQTDALPWSPVVAIQANGEKPPLFSFHPGGGTVLCYYELAQHLGIDQPFYGLQSIGMEAEQVPYTQINEMAAFYLQALQTIQPQGPYQLTGWSLGGLIALEIATQLQAQGESVSFLGLLDSVEPSARKDPQKPDDAQMLVNLYSNDIPLSLEHLQQLTSDEQLAYVVEQGKQVNFFPPDFDLAQAQRLMRVINSNAEATYSYQPHTYHGKIMLFQATEVNPEYAPLKADHGWGDYATEGVEIIKVPGNHINMVKSPHVQILADKMKGYFK